MPTMMPITTLSPRKTAERMMPICEKFLLRRSPSRFALLYATMLRISPTRLMTNAKTNPRIESVLSGVCTCSG